MFKQIVMAVVVMMVVSHTEIDVIVVLVQVLHSFEMLVFVSISLII